MSTGTHYKKHGVGGVGTIGFAPRLPPRVPVPAPQRQPAQVVPLQQPQHLQVRRPQPQRRLPQQDNG